MWLGRSLALPELGEVNWPGSTIVGNLAMAGFDLGELLPYYLDETDEQIGALNDALLKLEQDPSDAAVLREAFRMIHSIKGSSTVMGFDQVKHLTHHLETFFDQLRAGKRELDRPTLDLSFRCLDGLRDYHRELRSGNQDAVDLSGLTASVVASLGFGPTTTTATAAAALPSAQPAPAVVSDRPTSEAGGLRLTVVFDPGLPWADMKAKLVLNRLATRARILASDPKADQIEGVENLQNFTVWLIPECDVAELRTQADVDGVVAIFIEEEAAADIPSEPAESPQANPPVPSPMQQGRPPATPKSGCPGRGAGCAVEAIIRAGSEASGARQEGRRDASGRRRSARPPDEPRGRAGDQ